MPDKGNLSGVSFGFDVGHSSIGWAVLQNQGPHILGCGTVIFAADDCLARQRRDFRRQRRHIRSTRLRIRRLSLLLEHMGVLTREQLDAPGCAWPWLLAARVLQGGTLLSWPELWDVLRWYAHNRGYDGNKQWSRNNEAQQELEDTEKVENARALYQKHGTHTMAETFCAVCGLDPQGLKRSCNPPGEARPRGLNAAFPREDVVSEVQRLLRAHFGKLQGVDERLVQTLVSDWRVLPCPSITLPDRYYRGLLFGQLVPRFENRIIASCPITFESVFRSELAQHGDPESAKRVASLRAKVPSKECLEFYRFRWAMQLANVQVDSGGGRETRPLTLAERQGVNAKMQERGYLTPVQFKDAVRGLTLTKRDNLDQLLLHPDAQEALVLDPVQKLITSHSLLSNVWPSLPEIVQKRARGRLRKGKAITISELREQCGPDDRQKLDEALTALIDRQNTRKRKAVSGFSPENVLAEKISAPLLRGRAAYTRGVLNAAYEDVMTRAIHPKSERGVLFRDEAIRAAQLERELAEQTNNHLVRHRLTILDRLHRDLVREYAGGNASRVQRVTIEVNRELRDLSGKTRKEQEQELGRRLANFKGVVRKLEQAFDGQGIHVGPGLIRKARISEDLGWTCPYTGKTYDAFDLLHRRVDKDHIIPRSERPSDSLDSLVITFAEVNRMKGKRTALQFIEEFQGRPVEGLPNLTIRTLQQYQRWVEELKTRGGHDDDERRKKRRKELLQLRQYVEKEFTPGDLTQTSQLVRLGAQTLQRFYTRLGAGVPAINSLPGSVTGATRKGWRLLGCLARANPGVLNEEGEPRTKTEIRDITHLHHALDACVLALTAHFIPNNGRIWELLVRRESSLRQSEKDELQRLGVFALDAQGRFGLKDLDSTLKQELTQRLAEKRVVQHVPADMSGLAAKQTVWRVVDPDDQHPSAKRLLRWLSSAGVTVPPREVDNVVITCRKRRGQADSESGKVFHETKTWSWVFDDVSKSKLLGLEPRPGSAERLKRLKAVKILADNFGVALDPVPQVIRFHKVYPQLRELREKNGGRWPRVLRNGQLIQVSQGIYQGCWRVFSTKDNASGMAVDIGMPDVVRLRNKTPGHKLNVLLASLVKSGLVIEVSPLTGVSACPTTS